MSLIDQYAYSFSGRFHEIELLLDSGQLANCNKSTKDSARKFASLLEDALPDNPQLILECDALYSFLGRRVDRDFALQFRERIASIIDKDSAMTLAARNYSDWSKARRLYLYEPVCPFNESVLVFPMNQSREFYAQKRNELNRELDFCQKSVCSQEELEEVERKVRHGNNKIALFEAMTQTQPRVFDHAIEQLADDAFELESEDYEAFQNLLDKELNKSLSEVDARVVLLSRLALLARDFYSALDQGDDQIRAVGDKIIARAVKSDGAAKKVVCFGRELAKHNPQLAKEFMEKAIQSFFAARTASEKTLVDCVRYSQELDEYIRQSTMTND